MAWTRDQWPRRSGGELAQDQQEHLGVGEVILYGGRLRGGRDCFVRVGA